jgi:hypothetical protein
MAVADSLTGRLKPQSIKPDHTSNFLSSRVKNSELGKFETEN